MQKLNKKLLNLIKNNNLLNNKMNEPISIQVVLLGESGVGKTSIISQFISKKFNPKCSTSVSAQFTSKTIDFQDAKKSIRFDIWDTVGQEKYRSLTKIFYKDAKIIILVYDITTEYSFNELKEYWYSETIKNTDSETIYAVCANKFDLYEKQVVKNEEGRLFADKIHAIFQSTSATSYDSINTLFENLGRKIIDPSFDYKTKKKDNIKLDDKNSQNNSDNKKRCC